jgi:8-oxo-dGTP diphosphatase
MSQLPKRPSVGLGVVVARATDDGYVEILLGKRKGSHGAGKWSFPGGHLEWGESWAECAFRELKEETGLDFPHRLFQFVGATNDVLEDRHYVTLYMGVEAEFEDEPENLEPDKCEGWDWFTLDGGLPEDLWQPAKDLLREYPDRVYNLVPTV